MTGSVDAARPPARRSVTDVLRRGVDNSVANWQLLLIRIAEAVLFGIVLVGGAVVAIVPAVAMIAAGSAFGDLGPLLRSIQRGDVDASEVGRLGEALSAVLFASIWLVIYILIVVSILLLILVALHSFVMAGVARVFVDGDRAAGGGGSRTSMAAFSVDRWMAGGRESWWSVFWIYNIIYTVLSAVLLVPLLVVLALTIVLRGSPAAIAVGCLGLVLTFLIMVPLGVVANVWCQKAIVMAVLRRAGAMDAVGQARSAVLRDLGRHAGVAFILLVIAIGGGSALSMFSVVFSLPGSASSVISLALVPMRIAFSFLSSIFSAAVGNWLVASFAALSNPE